MENGKRQAGRKEFKSREDSRDGNGEEKGSNRLKKKKKVNMPEEKIQD